LRAAATESATSTGHVTDTNAAWTSGPVERESGPGSDAADDSEMALDKAKRVLFGSRKG